MEEKQNDNDDGNSGHFVAASWQQQNATSQLVPMLKKTLAYHTPHIQKIEFMKGLINYQICE